jgi:uncharacterized NAD-dependent epimerase/dehydratase family protein
MKSEGNAIVYCEAAFNTTNGKTAHGLIRFTKRYNVLSVIDSHCTGRDSGKVIDGKPNHIPIYATLEEAVRAAETDGMPATHLVVGLTPDGGRLAATDRADIIKAIQSGLHVDSGLHDFLSEDPEIMKMAAQKGIVVRDIRKPPPRSQLHFFSGKIEEVTALKIAVLGTDSAVGKRTTAWQIVKGFKEKGLPAELVGTGQTAWLQGAGYCLVLDSLVNDFVSGEIEHAVWSAWKEGKAQAIVIEGQGSLMNPAYPGGFEILAAGRPDVVVLQHAPARKEYDGFPGYPIQALKQQIHAIELISGKPVVAITVNHENIPLESLPVVIKSIEKETDLPTYDVLLDGALELVGKLIKYGSNILK